jgi:hypothetical protein
MKLKSDIKYGEFLKRVQTCGGEVHYATTGGDCLNLKSLLSEYVFLTAALSNVMVDGEIACADENDYVLLENYLC